MMEAADIRSETRKGLFYALAAYVLWGLFPLYWYPLDGAPIDAAQILAQRIVWSAAAALIFLFAGRKGSELLAVCRQPKLALALSVSAVCISINWLVYLWAVTNRHVLEAGLGYFISPLFNVLLGRMVLKESLNAWQKAALLLASAGIVWLALPAGQMPWVALMLAVSFGFYGLIRKIAPVGALVGLVWETLVVLPFALAYLVCVYADGRWAMGALNGLQTALLIGSGVATVVPLLCFAAGARRIPLSVLGMIQYGSPTIQILTGLWLFGETFDTHRFIGYLWVWSGVAIYLTAAWRSRPGSRKNG